MNGYALPNDPAWVKAAFGDLGLKEIPGPRHAARVVEMFRIAGHPKIKDDETAWCSAAANTWMDEAGKQGTNALNARSWLAWGKGLDNKKTLPRGAVLVFRRGNSSWQGHVCFLLADNGRTLTAIGGNQGNSVSIRNFPRETLIGARWPVSATNSTTLRFGGGALVAETASRGIDAAQDTISQNVDSISDTIGAAQSTVTEYAAYLSFAKGALTVLAIAALACMAYRFYVKHVRPAPLPEIGGGPSIDDEPEAEPRKRRTRR